MRTKNKKTDLEGKKILFFEAGVIIALCLILTAFEWHSANGLKSFYKNDYIPETIVEEIPITRQDELKPPPPPPVLTIPEIIVIHEDTDIIQENTDIFTEPDETVLKVIQPPSEDETIEEDPIPYVLIEQKPSFMGGDYNTFTRWVAKHLIYPEEAARNGIQGRVYLKFVIDIDGLVKNVEALSLNDRLLAEEAKRVVSSSPAWTPGRQRGQPAPVAFTFPVTFKLQ